MVVLTFAPRICILQIISHENVSPKVWRISNLTHSHTKTCSINLTKIGPVSSEYLYIYVYKCLTKSGQTWCKRYILIHRRFLYEFRDGSCGDNFGLEYPGPFSQKHNWSWHTSVTMTIIQHYPNRPSINDQFEKWPNQPIKTNNFKEKIFDYPKITETPQTEVLELTWVTSFFSRIDWSFEC